MLEILTIVMVQRVNVRHRDKFRVYRSNRCRDIMIFRFCKWRHHAIFVAIGQTVAFLLLLRYVTL